MCPQSLIVLFHIFCPCYYMARTYLPFLGVKIVLHNNIGFEEFNCLCLEGPWFEESWGTNLQGEGYNSYPSCVSLAASN